MKSVLVYTTLVDGVGVECSTNKKVFCEIIQDTFKGKDLRFDLSSFKNYEAQNPYLKGYYKSISKQHSKQFNYRRFLILYKKFEAIKLISMESFPFSSSFQLEIYDINDKKFRISITESFVISKIK